jgi:LmbE family N-acetylglucosaminyl deacetylase
VFAPHPDDEIIGAFSRLIRFRGASFLVFVTDGAPANLGKEQATLRDQRRQESEEIAASLGIPPGHVFRLGISDQETAFRLSKLVRDAFELLKELQPEAVLIPAYEGGHPDHDSTAFALHQASLVLGRNTPALIEMALYHDANGRIETGRFLGRLASTGVCLSAEEQRRKQKAFATYQSQREVLSQFSTGFERFRPAPNYDFRAPPHSGTLFYERFDWGVTGAQWRELAQQALTALDLR